MKIYTKTGDTGQTALIGGERVEKDDARIEAYGTIDELNATIGQAISWLDEETEDIGRILVVIQHHLFDIGAELASLTEKKTRIEIPTITEQKVMWLEQVIDLADEELLRLTQFILPGGQAAASALHVARTVCRRAERRLVSLEGHRKLNPQLIRYVNRLSDALFTLARLVNARTNTPDQPWQKSI